MDGTGGGYYMERRLELSFEEAVAATRDALVAEGMGVITEIRLDEKLREKLGVAHPPYLILGACHPPSAYRAVTEEEGIGVLLPCNVVVHVLEGGGTSVKAVRPSVSLAATGRRDLADLADEVEGRLRRVLEKL